MSILNTALQNCTPSHDSCSEEVEAKLKSVKSMAAFRVTIEEIGGIKDQWNAAVEEVKMNVAKRFSRVLIKKSHVL